MNIVNKLTIRQLVLNKKRTLVTIVGAIISVAMITAVATIGFSFMDLLQRQTIASDGEWHVLYEKVNKSQLEAIKTDKETKDVILSRDIGYALLSESKNIDKPYLFIKEYNEKGFEKFPIELNQGRLPVNNDEVVISKAILTNAKVNFEIGDTLTLDYGQRYSKDNKEELSQNYSLIREQDTISEDLTIEGRKVYTIVGIIERPTFEPTWSPGYTVLSYVNDKIITTDNTVNASVILKNIDDSMFEHAENIKIENGIEKIKFNNNLLRYYGVIKDDTLRKMLFNLSAIIMVVIIVGSISLIYNSFAISVSERSRHLGMLSSVGATKKQKRNSVFFEGLIIGLISIPIGIIAGYIGIAITFLFVNPMVKGALGISESFKVVVLPSTIFIAIIVSIITILVSTFIPAKRASNISAIDAIRQTTDVKLTNKVVKTSKLTRKIFGVEGELGLKNLKRNKGRYKATVFSLVISIILFLVVSYFTASLEKSILVSQDGINFDIQILLDGQNKNKEEIATRIASLDNITETTIINSFEAKTWIDEAFIADYLKDREGVILEDGKYPYYVSVDALDDEALRLYAEEVGVDFNLLKDTEKLSAIVIDTVKYKDMVADKYIETKSVKASIGEKLDLSYYKSDTESDLPLMPIEIIALTDKVPMGIMSMGASESFNIIVSIDVFNKIIDKDEGLSNVINTGIYLKSTDPLRSQEDIEAIRNTMETGIISIYNVYMGRQREAQMILLMSVFTYGFILLITAICITNILNTISTSITLRKREFAMLKSVGMTPKGFNKMINYESIFYGLKALIYGLPISIAVMYLIYRAQMSNFDYEFTIPWISVYIAIAAVFGIVGVAMLYSSSKVKKENIIDVLKQEII